MIIKKITVLMFLVLFGFVGAASAAVEKVMLRVDGLACPFCAYGLEKKVKKLPGYRALDIMINEGKVTVDWQKDKPLDIKRINEAVDKAGFTLRGVRGSFVGRLLKENENIFLLLDGPVKQRFRLYEDSVIKQKTTRRHELESMPQDFSETMRKRLEKIAAHSRQVRIVGPVHAHRNANRPLALGIEKLSVRESFEGILTKEKGRFFLVVSQPITRRFSLYEPNKLKLTNKQKHKLEGTDITFSEAMRKRLEELLATKRLVKVVGELHVHQGQELVSALAIEELEVVLPIEAAKSSDADSPAKSKKGQNEKEEK